MKNGMRKEGSIPGPIEKDRLYFVKKNSKKGGTVFSVPMKNRAKSSRKPRKPVRGRK